MSTLLAAAAGGCASTRSKTTSAQATSPKRLTSTNPAARPAPLTARAFAVLPAPVQAPATVASGDHLLLMGGLDQADASVSDVVSVSAGQAVVHREVPLPGALHDAAAAVLGGRSVLIGGGEPSRNEIVLVGPSGARPVVGQLPQPASDVAATAIGKTVYVVGGYTGAAPLDTIVAWTGRGIARVVAHLPHPLRYAAVGASSGRLIVAGGTSGTTATRDVYAFDPATGRISRVAFLPRPLTHAAAAVLNGYVYVLGGRGSAQGSQTSEILAIDPRQGRVTRAGRLPLAVSDCGAAAVSGAILLAGGRTGQGVVSDRIFALRPTSGVLR